MLFLPLKWVLARGLTGGKARSLWLPCLFSIPDVSCCGHCRGPHDKTHLDPLFPHCSKEICLEFSL